MNAVPAPEAHPQDRTDLQALRERMREATLRPETPAVEALSAELLTVAEPLAAAREQAMRWVGAARTEARAGSLVESLLGQFALDSAEGKALMSLAEALLRTPDDVSADRLIAERLRALRSGGTDANLKVRLGLALLRTAGRVLPDAYALLTENPAPRHLLAPTTRRVMRRAMRLMGHAFIVGESIEAALARGAKHPELALCSFDMLGEGARTDADAERYFQAYHDAIEALGRQPAGAVHARSGISVKLSALEPRYQLTQRPRVLEQLVPRVMALTRAACRAGIRLGPWSWPYCSPSPSPSYRSLICVISRGRPFCTAGNHGSSALTFSGTFITRPARRCARSRNTRRWRKTGAGKANRRIRRNFRKSPGLTGSASDG